MIEIKIQKRLFFLRKWGGEPRQVNSKALMEKKKNKTKQAEVVWKTNEKEECY